MKSDLSLVLAAGLILLVGCERPIETKTSEQEKSDNSVVNPSKKPIPLEVLELVLKDEDITFKKVIFYEWRGEDQIHIMTGTSDVSLGSNGQMFDAMRSEKGWSLQSLAPWHS